jgi:hypothetical protein
MPTIRFTPRPEPGALIQSQWLNQLADAVSDLQDALAAATARIAALEKPPAGGPRTPGGFKVGFDPNKLKQLLDKEKPNLDKLTTNQDKVTAGLEVLYKYRQDIVPDAAPGDPSPEEMVSFLAEIGVKPVDAVSGIKQVDTGLGMRVDNAMAQAGTNPIALQSNVFNKMQFG